LNETPPVEQWTSYRYCRNVLDSDPYGIANHFQHGIKQEFDRMEEYSLSQIVHFSQNRFCEMLKTRLDEKDMRFTDLMTNNKYSPLLFNHQYMGYDFDEDEYRIKVRAVDTENSEVRNIHCKYLIG